MYSHEASPHLVITFYNSKKILAVFSQEAQTKLTF